MKIDEWCLQKEGVCQQSSGIAMPRPPCSLSHFLFLTWNLYLEPTLFTVRHSWVKSDSREMKADLKFSLQSPQKPYPSAETSNLLSLSFCSLKCALWSSEAGHNHSSSLWLKLDIKTDACEWLLWAFRKSDEGLTQNHHWGLHRTIQGIWQQFLRKKISEKRKEKKREAG